MPTISVIIPTYNRADYLPGAVQSVLEQRVPVTEILIVDDGSTDHTESVVAGLSGPIRLLQQTNQGPAAARNLGLSAAQGDWIALLDSDDLWEPERIEAELTALEANPRAGLAHAAAALMDREGKPLGEIWRRPEFQGRVDERLLISNGINASSVLVRRDLLLAAGGWDARFRALENWDTWIRVARRCEFVFVDRALMRYRWHSGNLIKDLELQRVAYRLLLQKSLEDAKPQPAQRLRREAWARHHRAFADAYVGRGEYAPAQQEFLASLFYEPLQLQVWWRLMRTTQARLMGRSGGARSGGARSGGARSGGARSGGARAESLAADQLTVKEPEPKLPKTSVTTTR